jgi:cytidylate kinase
MEERAKRRFEQLKASNIEADYKIVLQDIIKRDENDSTRQFSPLRMAEDALLIDTTNLDIQSVIKTIAQYIGGSNVL